MLEKPDLQDETIIACVQDAYGLLVDHIAFLPIGADLNTVVYRIVAADETPYFLKLRRGAFDETSVTFPSLLSDRGITHIIAPLVTQVGRLWAVLGDFKVILHPFVAGRNGYELALSERHWADFGAALKSIHTVETPPTLTSRIPTETYSPEWREIVKAFLARVEHDTFDDPVAVELAAFLQAKRDEIHDLVGRAERLAQALQNRSSAFIVCHADLHAGNILIDANDALYIVDWDTLILAPKERDLMFVGAGLMGGRRTPEEEETMFYRAYGQTEIDPVALAYYHYERIIQDIAVDCEIIFSTSAGGEDREQSLRYLTSNFLPNSTIEIACKADSTLG
jgi:spectinomycin phosphotransferase